MKRFAGQVAIVTGGARALARPPVCVLAEEGARVVVPTSTGLAEAFAARLGGDAAACQFGRR